MCPALDAGFFYCSAAMPGDAAAECWGALTGSGQTLFDNRKAGKSTPIIPTGLRSAGTPWCGFITSLLELSKTVENKGSSNNCLMKCGYESQCPVLGDLPSSKRAETQGIWSRRQSGRRNCKTKHGWTFPSKLRRTAKTDWVSFMIKLLRAYGGCLGARRR